MTINEAQQQVDGWIKTVGVRYFSELTNMAILNRRSGRVGPHYGPYLWRPVFKKTDLDKNLADEMADVLWVLICLANQTGVNLNGSISKKY